MSELFRIGKHGTVDHPYHPNPDTHVIVTTVDGRRVAMHTPDEFNCAIEGAVWWADLERDGTAKVEVQCWHLRDLLQALNIDPKTFAPDITRDYVVAVLKKVLRECNDYAVRGAAYDELVKLGVL